MFGFLQIIINICVFCMFFRLISCLYRNGFLKDSDLSYITSLSKKFNRREV